MTEQTTPAPPDFDELNSVDMSTIKRPPLIPRGDWLLVFKTHEKTLSSQKKTPGYTITFGVIEPREGVDVDMLAAYKEEGGDFSMKEMNYTFYMTQAAAPMLVEFLRDKMGISTDGKTISQGLAEATGGTVIGKIAHTPSANDPQRNFAEIKGFAPAS